ncbi:MAG: radical SAM protein, partial [Phycisphaerae bacterium]
LPSLGLLYLAAVTPPGHDLAYYEAERDGAEPAEVYTCDLVAISTFSAQVMEAYAIAGRLRAAGVKVAMGGLHVSVLPDEAARHADYVIVGEGENVWPAIVEHADGDQSRIPDRGLRTEKGCGLPVIANPQSEIRNPKSIIVRSREFPPIDVARLPVPRYDLLGDRPYNRFTVQSSRGCPWRCDFCASTVMLAEKYRKRPVADVIRDIRAIMAVRERPFIEFADDNTFVDKAWGKELCRQLIPLRLKWFTETDVTVADDPELLELMHEAGCRQVLIGLESPTQGALKGIEMHADAKAKWADKYAERVERIQRTGVTVNGCFILGLDGHTPRIFEDVLDFSVRHHLYDVQITILTAFPGTPLYARLLKEGRILEPGRWELCTLFDVNYEPRGMSVAELREGMYWLTERLYSAECTEQRRGPFFANLRRRGEGVTAGAIK